MKRNDLRFSNSPLKVGILRRYGFIRPFLIVIGIAGICFGAAVASSAQLTAIVLDMIVALRGRAPDSHWSQIVRIMGMESLIVGFVIVVIASFILPQWDRFIPLLAKDRYLICVATIVLIALWLPVVLIGRSSVIAGERYWWLGDDAMISMRYAKNLAQGHGFVWNPGEMVEGFTNPLWTLYMAFLHLFQISASRISLVVLLSNLALGIVTIPAIVGLVHALGGRYLSSLAAVASYVLSRDVLYNASYGLETTCLTLFVVVATLRVIQDAQLKQIRLTTYLLIGVLPLVRTDAIVISFLLYLIALVLAEERKRVLVLLVISLLIPIGAEILRFLYYGDVLPNTAYLKATGWDNRYIAGLRYTGDILLHYSIPLTCVFVGVATSKNRAWRLLVGFFTIYLVYITYIGGDVFLGFRFLMPIFPLLASLAFVVVEQAEWPRFQNRHRIVIGVLSFLSVPLVFPGYGAFLFPYPGDAGNVEIGLLLNQHTSTTAKIADFWAGSVLYFTDRYGIDMLGKSDYYIARLSAKPYGILPGHNKYDFDYSLGFLRPDYIVAPFKLPVNDDEMRSAEDIYFPFIRELYFHPMFQAHCLSNPISVESWRTIFVCDWSMEITRSRSWAFARP